MLDPGKRFLGMLDVAPAPVSNSTDVRSNGKSGRATSMRLRWRPAAPAPPRA